MASIFLRGSTPVPGQMLTSKSFGSLADASTAARQSPSQNVFGVQAAGGFVEYPTLARPGGASTPSIPPLNPASDVSTNASPMVTITYGTYSGSVPTISGTALVPATASNIITLGDADIVVYLQCDFAYGGGLVSVVDDEVTSTSSTVPPSTITSSGGGSGSGTLYQELFGVTITAPVGSGPYKVVFAPAVGGSQNFGICLDPAGGSNDSILGPWGV